LQKEYLDYASGKKPAIADRLSDNRKQGWFTMETMVSSLKVEKSREIARREKMERVDVGQMKRMFEDLFEGKGVFGEASPDVEEEFTMSNERKFITNSSDRGLISPSPESVFGNGNGTQREAMDKKMKKWAATDAIHEEDSEESRPSGSSAPTPEPMEYPEDDHIIVTQKTRKVKNRGANSPSPTKINPKKSQTDTSPPKKTKKANVKILRSNRKDRYNADSGDEGQSNIAAPITKREKMENRINRMKAGEKKDYLLYMYDV
jgi:hypothetical protein